MALRDWFRRAPSQTQQSTVGSLFGPKKTATPRGVETLLAAYSMMPWLRAINSRISYSVGSTEWKMYLPKKGTTRKSNDYDEIPSHPFLDLLTRGSDLLAGSTVLRVTQTQIDLVGEGFLLFEVDGMTTPKDMFNVPPTWVKEIPGFRGKNEFSVLFPGSQSPIPVPPDQIVWFKDPDPSDPYGRGRGVAFALAKELDIDDAAAEHARDFFLNSARSDFVFIAPGVTQPTADAFLEKWNQKNQGSWWKPSIINREMKIEKMTQDFSGLGMAELRVMERDIITQVYGIPPEMLGIIESSNRATIDSADYLMARYVVSPRLEAMREPLQRAFNRFFPKEQAVIDYVSPVTEDFEFKKSVMVGVPHAFYVDDHRELAGLGPLDNGMGQVFVAPFSSVASDTPAGGGKFDEDEKAAWLGVTKVSQSDIQRIVRRIDPKSLVKATKGVIYETVDAFGKQMVRDLAVEISFDIDNPRVIAYLDHASSRRITRINNTTRAAVRRQLSEGVAAGESIPKLADRIQSVFKTASDSRARTIARTETISASGFGNLEAMTQADITQKEWLSTMDDATRDTHVEMDGQVVDMEDDFESPSGAHGPHPGEMGEAAEDVNCRCTVLPVIGKSSIGNTHAKRVSLWQAKELSRIPFEKKLTRRLKSAFYEQRAAVLAALGQ